MSSVVRNNTKSYLCTGNYNRSSACVQLLKRINYERERKSNSDSVQQARVIATANMAVTSLSLTVKLCKKGKPQDDDLNATWISLTKSSNQKSERWSPGTHLSERERERERGGDQMLLFSSLNPEILPLRDISCHQSRATWLRTSACVATGLIRQRAFTANPLAVALYISRVPGPCFSTGRLPGGNWAAWIL